VRSECVVWYVFMLYGMDGVGDLDMVMVCMEGGVLCGPGRIRHHTAFGRYDLLIVAKFWVKLEEQFWFN
jgi:hypothetical protein